MRHDQILVKAVERMARMGHMDGAAHPEAHALGVFCREILLPLMTAHANTTVYKMAYHNLIERGRRAELITTKND